MPSKGGDGGFVVGHVQERGDTAAHGCSRARTEVFFLGLPGVPEVDLWVDHTGQKMKARAVDEQLVLEGSEGFAEGYGFDDAVSNSQVTDARFIGQNHGSALNQDVAVHVALSGLEPGSAHEHDVSASTRVIVVRQADGRHRTRRRPCPCRDRS